jgi:hypothetical protein
MTDKQKQLEILVADRLEHLADRVAHLLDRGYHREAEILKEEGMQLAEAYDFEENFLVIG